jgi:hypothetical protein
MYEESRCSNAFVKALKPQPHWSAAAELKTDYARLFAKAQGLPDSSGALQSGWRELLYSYVLQLTAPNKHVVIKKSGDCQNRFDSPLTIDYSPMVIPQYEC